MLSKDRSIFEGVYTLAKFYLSRSPEGKMNCISRTLGKFSIIDRDFDGTVNDQDIWVCKIVKEIQPRKNIGAFVLRPIELVDIDKVKKIIPGFYDAQPMGKVISIIPNTDPSDYWMLSKTTRKIFSKKYYAVVVPIAYKNRDDEDDDDEKLYPGETPEMLAAEPLQAMLIKTGEVVKVFPIQSQEGQFVNAITCERYSWTELKPVKIKAEQETISLIAPEISAKFSVTAEFV